MLILLTLSFYVYLSTWRWDDLLADEYPCRAIAHGFDTNTCMDKMDIAVGQTALGYSLFMTIFSHFLYYIYEHKPVDKDTDDLPDDLPEDFLVSKKIYYLTMIYFLLSIICAVIAVNIFNSQANEFYSSLGEEWDSFVIPNLWLVNSLLIAPTLLIWIALAIAGAEGLGWHFVNANTLLDGSGTPLSLACGTPAMLRGREGCQTRPTACWH